MPLLEAFLVCFVTELKGPVGQMIQTDNRGLLAVERNKVITGVLWFEHGNL